MLRSLQSLEGYKVNASDGDLGTISDVLLDDERWAVRYLVVDTGGLLGGRRVLISPISFGELDWQDRRFHLSLTKEKIKGSPGIDADRPVSRQHEREYHRYYGYPNYWGYKGFWGMGAYPGLLGTNILNEEPGEHPEDKPGDVHLRSAKEVRGYHVEGSDDAIGHVEDFFADEASWVVRYLAIDTSNWWFGRKVLISPAWASRISWDERKIFLELSRHAIKNSPAWNGTAMINREYEQRLHHHYGHPAYWEGGDHTLLGVPYDAPLGREERLPASQR